jgi:curved DNA-binding protein
MPGTSNERRRQPRTPRLLSRDVRLSFSAGGATEMAPARLIDVTESGWGVETAQPLSTGTLLTLSGEALAKGAPGPSCVRARVTSCQRKGSLYRIGLSRAAQASSQPEESAAGSGVSDHYEALQLSPNADLDTIHRVYRLLAQRYHPDNAETGSQERFRAVAEAYKVLSDADRRAAYDVDYAMTRRLRWRIFDQRNSGEGIEAERRKRTGILALLYHKRLHAPDHPGITLNEMEDLLGTPREHLEFSLWYLKEHALVARSDNGRFAITVRGVDEAEKQAPEATGASKLLTGPASVGGYSRDNSIAPLSFRPVSASP